VKDTAMTTTTTPSTGVPFLFDTAVLTKRSLRHVVRSPDTIITTAAARTRNTSSTCCPVSC
jgi:hypothetical protein